MVDFLARYLAGARAEVWQELYHHGPAIRDDGDLWLAARQIAQVTMVRARFNIELLIPRLRARGYRFSCPDRIYAPPAPTIEEELAEIEETAGAIPLALRTWFSVVGNVNLMGYLPAPGGERHKAWDGEHYSDPLVVEYDIDYFRSEYDDWRWDHSYEDINDPFVLQFAPDELHKDDVSGGDPYAIALDDASIDAPILYQWHDLTFVNYLRESFHWGGFLGLSRLSSPPLDLIAELRAGMLPL